MSILDLIVADKRIEITQRKKLFPSSYWESSPLFERQSNSLVKSLSDSNSGIIAEHKRRSPSKQNINSSLSVTDVAGGYEKAGACGMSVLTDGKYFGGSLNDLNLARSVTSFPVLRKEFIIDEYQIIEAKAHGADAILLIAGMGLGIYAMQQVYFTQIQYQSSQQVLEQIYTSTDDEVEFSQQQQPINERLLSIFNDVPVFESLSDTLLNNIEVYDVNYSPDVFGQLEIDSIKLNQYIILSLIHI